MFSPSGAVGDCGISPIMVATWRVGMVPMAFPSSSTDPDRGVSIRASALRKVDLPQPFAPMIEVIIPWGTSRSRPWTTVRFS